MTLFHPSHNWACGDAGVLPLLLVHPRGAGHDAGAVLPAELCAVPAAVLVCVSLGQDIVEQPLLPVWFGGLPADIHGCSPLLV